MGVYINMKMPKSCSECFMKFCDGRKTVVHFAVERGDNCPLVPVPEHGKLIEKNPVFELIRSFPNVDRQLPVEFMKALYELPTVIEAEEGE